MLSTALALMLVGADVGPKPYEITMADKAYEPFFKCVRLEARYYALRNASATATEISTTANSDCASIATDAGNDMAKDLLGMAIAMPEQRNTSEVIRQLDAREHAIGLEIGTAEAVKARSRK